MSDVYSTRLFTGHAVSSASFTVDAGQVWVVRTITVFWPGGSVAPGAQLVEVATSVTVWWDTDAITVAGLYHHLDDVRLVLEGGGQYDVLGFGDPDITLNGYVLTP